MTAAGGGGGVGGSLTPSGGSGGNASCADADKFDARVRLEGSTWRAEHGTTQVYAGANMMDAMTAALNSLTPNRTKKESVIVCGNGTMGNLDGTAIKAVNVPSYTVLDLRGTMRIEDGGDFANYVPIQCLGTTDIDIPNARIEGNPRYSFWIRSCKNVHLGHIEIQHSNVIQIGLGIRVDTSYGGRPKNIRVDYLYANKTGSHGIETVAVDGMHIGHVKAVDTGEAGVLLQGEGAADVALIEADNASEGKGYAALRFANSAGPGIVVDKVVARRGGRGIFCVSQSRGIEIKELDIADTGGESILIENCYDVKLATVRGTVKGKEVRIASRAEFPPSTGVTLTNLTLTDSRIRDTVCDGKNVVKNNTLVNSTLALCPGTDGGGNVIQ
jgi:hypothetical protein